MRGEFRVWSSCDHRSKDSWVIGGDDNVHENTCVKKLGTHTEIEVHPLRIVVV